MVIYGTDSDVQPLLCEPDTEGAGVLLLPCQARRGRVRQRFQLALAWRRGQPGVPPS